jgi:hypothetical protein
MMKFEVSQVDCYVVDLGTISRTGLDLENSSLVVVIVTLSLLSVHGILDFHETTFDTIQYCRVSPHPRDTTGANVIQHIVQPFRRPARLLFLLQADMRELCLLDALKTLAEGL